MVLKQEKNPFPLIRYSNEKVETLPGVAQYASASAVLSAFDFGGWCRLKVTAEVQGQILTGYLTSDTDKVWPEIRIPRRQEGSHIADAWLEQEGAVGMEDGVDDENAPVGDGHVGDGFSLYEEYRGFAQNGAILRTKAKKKDLMVLNTVGGPGAAACQLFKRMSQVEVNHTFRPVEFSSDGTKDNWLNFNHASHHLTAQHGLRIVLDTADQGYASANNLGAGDGNSTPGSKRDITVPPSFNANAARNGRARAGRYAAASYAHEMAHGCAIYHHGSGDPGEVDWTARDGTSGQIWLENGATIVPRSEAGQILVLRPSGVDENGNSVYPKLTIELARQEGQHSGDTSCAMRYDVAEAYIYPAGSNGRYGKADKEVFGTALCTSRTGTGVNLPGRLPQPRTGMRQRVAETARANFA